jgi:hypothetical protein
VSYKGTQLANDPDVLVAEFTFSPQASADVPVTLTIDRLALPRPGDTQLIEGPWTFVFDDPAFGEDSPAPQVEVAVEPTGEIVNRNIGIEVTTALLGEDEILVRFILAAERWG